MNDIIEKVGEEFRAYYMEYIISEKGSDYYTLCRSTGILEAALAFENILCKHLTMEINNDNERIENLLNSTDTSPECGGAKDR